MLHRPCCLATTLLMLFCASGARGWQERYDVNSYCDKTIVVALDFMLTPDVSVNYDSHCNLYPNPPDRDWCGRGWIEVAPQGLQTITEYASDSAVYFSAHAKENKDYEMVWDAFGKWNSYGEDCAGTPSGSGCWKWDEISFNTDEQHTRFKVVNYDGYTEIEIYCDDYTPPYSPTPSPIPSNSPPSPQNPSDGGGSSIGVIVGGIVGGVVLVAVAVGAFMYMRKKKASSETSNAAFKSSPFEGVDAYASTTGTTDIAKISGVSVFIPPPIATTTKPGSSSLSSLSSMRTHSSIATDPLLTWIASSTIAFSKPNIGKKTPSGHLLKSLEQWELSFDELHFKQRLGAGSFGNVYMAEWHETPVAVKILLDASASSSNPAAVMQVTQAKLADEVSVMCSMRHPNIVGFLGFSLSPPCIVSELCSNGSLYELLQAGLQNSPEAATVLSWNNRVKFMTDAATGLLYLHSKHIVHRDVKSPNLLIANDWTVKVADFNLSKVVEEVTKTVVTSAGGPTNPRWLAPEILEGDTDKQSTTASDVYSFGVVLWETLTWNVPWSHIASPWQIVKNVTSGQQLPVPPRDKLPGLDKSSNIAPYVSLMQKCCALDPAKRPTFHQIVQELKAMQ